MKLPFLYAHGPLVWKTLLVVLVAFACWMVSRRRRRAGAPPLPIAWWVFWVVFVGAIGLGVMAGTGACALDRARDENGRFSEVASFDSLAIAAAMPGSHEDALKELDDRLSSRFMRTEETFQLAAAVTEVRGWCPFRQMFDAQRYEQAVDTARRCGRPDDQAMALAVLGRYDEAAALARDPELVSRIAVLQHRWADAAAAELARDRPCHAAFLRWFAADRAAFEGVALGSGVCRLMNAVSRRREDGGAAIAELKVSKEETTASILQKQLAILLGWTGRETWFRDLTFPNHDATPWLAESALRDLPSPRRDVEAALRARVAVAAMIRGDFARVRTELAIVDRFESWRADSLSAIASLIDPEMPAPRLERARYSVLERQLLLRARGQAKLPEQAFEQRDALCQIAYVGALRHAWEGDGRDLTWVLSNCDVRDAMQPWDLVAVLPRVTVGRVELASAVRLVSDGSMAKSVILPFGALTLAARRREMSRAIGDTEEVARMQALIDRHAAALSDPDVALALMFLQEWYE